MNIKPVSTSLVILIAVIAQTPLHAQSRSTDAGFRVGGIPASPNPVQGMTTPPIQGMTTVPIAPMGGGIAVQQTTPVVYPQVLIGSFMGTNGLVTMGNNFAVLPPGGTIFVPAGTLVVESAPGQQPGTFLTAPAIPEAPPTPRSPQGSRGGVTTNQSNQSNQRAGRGSVSPEPEPSRLALGTPRDKVIEKYGNPVAYLMNMNGETLYFKDGVVVFVRDGVIASPVQ